MSGYEEDAHAHHGHPGAPLAFLVLALFAGIFARTLLPKKLPYTVWLLGLGVVAGVVWDHEDAKTAHLGKVERMLGVSSGSRRSSRASLLNDGTAIVIFSVFYRRCAREGVSSLGFAVVAPYALRMALCGPLLGAAVGQAASVFLGFVYEDRRGRGRKRVIQRRFNVAEIALTLAAAYGTFCLCEMVTVDGASFTSGVLALVALGVTLGARGREHGTAAAAHRLHAFWELAGFVANTSIFFVAGAMIASRFGALGWGALRGAVGLALALVVEENENIDARVRDDVMSAVAGITCLTLVVNGTSMEFALAKLGLSQPSVEEERRFRATCRELGERSDATLRDVVERDRYLGGADAAVVCQYLPVHDAATYASRSPRAREARVPFVLRRRWAGYARGSSARPAGAGGADARRARSGARRRVAAVLKAELWHLHHAGFVSADSLELLAEVCGVAVDRIFRLEKGRRAAYAIDLDFPERCGGGPLKAWRLFKLQFAFECATNFARACERAARDAAAGGEDASAGRLRDDVGKAEAWIGAYASAFPEMARTVKTEAAVRVLLRREAANAEKLLHSGRIDCGERERFARKLAISERKCGLQYSGLVSFFDFLFTGHSEAFADVGACLRAAPELAAVGDVAPLARLGRDAVLGADDDLERALAGAWAFVVSGGLRVCGATFGPGSCVGLALCANQIFNPTSIARGAAGPARRAPDADNGALGFGGEGYVEDPCELPEAALRSHARAPRDRSGGPGVRRRAPTLAAALEAAATPGGPAPPAPSRDARRRAAGDGARLGRRAPPSPRAAEAPPARARRTAGPTTRRDADAASPSARGRP
ncbi:potassium:proton antiporter [Aureococcus anophagefferens]|nr:potassium:proton antiporter [Aureococcus anophagefferens]